MKYKAFLSYSHQDAAWAGWLHEKLERYRIPAALRSGHGPNRTRIGTVFKDREELATSHSLGEAIEQALQESEFQIVIASSHASASRWVNEEIRVFLQHADPSRLILVIPPDEQTAGLPSFEALSDQQLEPIAADARKDADGRLRALRKVLARLLDVDFDELQQRDRRRARQRLAVAGVAIVFLVGSVSFFALESRRSAQEAETQRTQAAQLANFLVDDLSVRLDEYEEVGTLDAGLARALDFFERVDPADMDLETLENYRAALTGVGSVRIRQGKPEDALVTFMRAEQVSLQIADREVSNAERWHEQAESSYYIGEAYWEMQDVPSAAAYIEKSMEYADRALQLAPDDYNYQLEVIFALNNLGAIHTRLKNWAQAEEFSMRALRLADERLAAGGNDEEQRLEVLNQRAEAVSWLVEITQSLGRLEEAFDWHEQEISLRHELIEATDIPQQSARLVDALGYYSKSLGAVGRLQEQGEALEQSIEICRKLSRDDPENVFWRLRLHNNLALLGMNLLARGDRSAAERSLEESRAGLERIIDEQGTPVARMHLAYVLSSQAYLLMSSSPAAAQESLDEAFAALAAHMEAETVHPVAASHFARATVIETALNRLAGEPNRGHRIARALGLVDVSGDYTRASIFLTGYQALLLLADDRVAEAEPLSQHLSSVGYRPPFFVCMQSILTNGSRGLAADCPK